MLLYIVWDGKIQIRAFWAFGRFYFYPRGSQCSDAIVIFKWKAFRQKAQREIPISEFPTFQLKFNSIASEFDRCSKTYISRYFPAYFKPKLSFQNENGFNETRVHLNITTLRRSHAYSIYANWSQSLVLGFFPAVFLVYFNTKIYLDVR